MEYLHNAFTTHQLFCMVREKCQFGIIRSAQTVPYLQLVGYKEHRLVFGNTPDSLTEDMGTHTGINSAQRVIQQEYGPFAVEGTCQAHSLTLPSAQVGTSLSNLVRKEKKSSIKPSLLWLH